MVYRTTPDELVQPRPHVVMAVCGTCGLTLPWPDAGCRSETTCQPSKAVAVDLADHLFLRVRLQLWCTACGLGSVLCSLPDAKARCIHCGIFQKAPAVRDTLAALRRYLDATLVIQASTSLLHRCILRDGQVDARPWHYTDGAFVLRWVVADIMRMEVVVGLPLCPDCSKPLSLFAKEPAAQCRCGFTMPVVRSPGWGRFVGVLRSTPVEETAEANAATLPQCCAGCGRALTIADRRRGVVCSSCQARLPATELLRLFDRCWIPQRLRATADAASDVSDEPLWLVYRGLPDTVHKQLRRHRLQAARAELEI